MRAYFLQSVADRMNLELREVPAPQPAAHQHLVKIHASSLNRGELIAGHGLIAAGAAKPAGQEAAGEVVGSGERVMGRCPGGFAEFGLMDKTDAIPVPPNLSWEEAGAIPLTFMVVHDMLVEQGGLKAGSGCSSPACPPASASPRCRPARRSAPGSSALRVRRRRSRS